MNPQISKVDSSLSDSLKMDLKLNKLTLFKARVKSVPYILWLWHIRNVEILICLLENYEKIPEQTPTRFIVRLFKNSSLLKRMLYKRAKNLRAKLY